MNMVGWKTTGNTVTGTKNKHLKVHFSMSCPLKSNYNQIIELWNSNVSWCFVVVVAFFGTKRTGNALSFHPEAHLNVCPRPYYSAAVSLTPCSHVWFDESLPGSEKSLPNTVTMHSNSLPSIVTCCLSLLQTPTHCTEITQHWFAQSSDSRLDLIPYI